MLSDSSYTPRSRLLRVLALVPALLIVYDTEIGPNDVRLSHMGTDGSTTFGLCDSRIGGSDALFPVVAYNSTDHEYLVVWAADDTNDYRMRIFAQRIDAATGVLIGANPTVVSDLAPWSPDAYQPAVAYNTTNNEYLVVWSGLIQVTTGFPRNEIFVQRLTAAAAETGTNDLRISNIGPPDDDMSQALNPAVDYNQVNNEYLVVWRGYLSNDGTEIFGQRIDAASGQETGADDFLVSDIVRARQGAQPDVAYNRANNEYLVVWRADVPSALYVVGQRLAGASGAELGSDDFGISDTDFGGEPSVAHGHDINQYLVVWSGRKSTGSELEIFGQRLWGDTAVEVGPTDFRISDMGPDASTDYGAIEPDVIWDAARREFVVVWSGDDNTGSMADGEYEIYGQRIDGATSAEVGTNDFRISDMGPDGNAAYDAGMPAIARSGNQGCLVVWRGDDNTGTLVDDECEVFGQRLALPNFEIFVGSPDAGPEG